MRAFEVGLIFNKMEANTKEVLRLSKLLGEMDTQGNSRLKKLFFKMFFKFKLSVMIVNIMQTLSFLSFSSVLINILRNISLPSCNYGVFNVFEYFNIGQLLVENNTTIILGVFYTSLGLNLLQLLLMLGVFERVSFLQKTMVWYSFLYLTYVIPWYSKSFFMSNLFVTSNSQNADIFGRSTTLLVTHMTLSYLNMLFFVVLRCMMVYFQKLGNPAITNIYNGENSVYFYIKILEEVIAAYYSVSLYQDPSNVYLYIFTLLSVIKFVALLQSNLYYNHHTQNIVNYFECFSCFYLVSIVLFKFNGYTFDVINITLQFLYCLLLSQSAIRRINQLADEQVSRMPYSLKSETFVEVVYCLLVLVQNLNIPKKRKLLLYFFDKQKSLPEFVVLNLEIKKIPLDESYLSTLSKMINSFLIDRIEEFHRQNRVNLDLMIQWEFLLLFHSSSINVSIANISCFSSNATLDNSYILYVFR